MSGFEVYRHFTVVVAAAITSALAWLVARRLLGWRPVGLAAVGLALDCLGLTAVFFVLDLTVGLAALLALRALGVVVSLYAMTDAMLLVLALFQGLVFSSWRVLSRRASRERA